MINISLATFHIFTCSVKYKVSFWHLIPCLRWSVKDKTIWMQFFFTFYLKCQLVCHRRPWLSDLAKFIWAQSITLFTEKLVSCHFLISLCTAINISLCLSDKSMGLRSIHICLNPQQTVREYFSWNSNDSCSTFGFHNGVYVPLTHNATCPSVSLILLKTSNCEFTLNVWQIQHWLTLYIFNL